jgi:hypothetical protein
VIARALEKDPVARFATGEAMAEAIGALQLRTREVAPLLRLIHQQTAHALQALLTLAVVFSIFWQFSSKATTIFGSMVAVLFATVAVTIVTQGLDRVRFAVRQGFTVEDVRAAFKAIADEIERGREQLVADPVERGRITRRKRIAGVCGFLGGVSLPFMFRLVRFGGPRGTDIDTTGSLVLLLGTIAIGVSIALWTQRPVRVTLAQRAANRIWISKMGRAIFARAQRRYAAEIAR